MTKATRALPGVFPAVTAATRDELVHPPIAAPPKQPPPPAASNAPVSRKHHRSVRRLTKQTNSDDAVKKLCKKKAGWGAYSTAVNERAVVFSLTLDAQQLKQEIQSLTVARNILLATRALNQRHDPNGSLVRSVKAYYEIIRTGITPEHSGVGSKRPRRTAYSQHEQRAFLDTFVDPDIDFGGGLIGVDVMFEQLQRYSVFLKLICLELQAFDIVSADDTVVITTTGTLHFQILRSTIAGVFPHILGSEWLVSKLVGREVKSTVALSFYFNRRDMVNKYVVDLDFCKSFTELLSDPVDVNLLFGRALIGDNCMFAAPISDLALGTDESEQQLTLYQPSREVRIGAHHVAHHDPLSPHASGCSSASSSAWNASDPPNEHDEDARSDRQWQQYESHASPTRDDFHAVVRGYFDVFARVAHLRSSGALSDEQRAFISDWVSPECEFGDADGDADAAAAVGRHALEERWCALASGFDVIAFVQTSQDPLVVQPHVSLCFVRATGEYALRITARTIARVLPHVATDALLVDALLGAVLSVRTQLKFWLEHDSGLVACMKEEMDFHGALAQHVAYREDIDWVLAHARLAKDGVWVDILHEPHADAGGAPSSDELGVAAAVVYGSTTGHWGVATHACGNSI